MITHLAPQDAGALAVHDQQALVTSFERIRDGLVEAVDCLISEQAMEVDTRIASH